MSTGRLARLLGLSLGYLSVVFVQRVAAAAERAAQEWEAEHAGEDGPAEPEAFDASDVLAGHTCVCCLSGAASWPPADAEAAAAAAAS